MTAAQRAITDALPAVITPAAVNAATAAAQETVREAAAASASEIATDTAANAETRIAAQTDERFTQSAAAPPTYALPATPAPTASKLSTTPTWLTASFARAVPHSDLFHHFQSHSRQQYEIKGGAGGRVAITRPPVPLYPTAGGLTAMSYCDHDRCAQFDAAPPAQIAAIAVANPETLLAAL